MVLRKIIAVLAPVACGVVIAACVGVYVLGHRQASHFQFETVRASARGVAQTLRRELENIDAAVRGLATQPSLPALFSAFEDQRLAAEAQRLSALLPGNPRVRLLKPGVEQIDTSAMPQMGFADLEMVRRTAAGESVMPMVHAFGSENGHLAAAAPVMDDARVVGVLLASFSTDFISRALRAAAVDAGAVELLQGDLTLGAFGTADRQAPAFTLRVPGTAWQIHGWVAPFEQSGSILGFTVAIVLSACVLIAALFFIAYRRFADYVEQDFELMHDAVSEFVEGRPKGSYPVKLAESQVLIARLARGKTRTPVWMRGAHEKRRIDTPRDKESDLPIAIFRPYDIRGVVGGELDRDVVYDIGRALGSEVADCGESGIIIARDGRNSSRELGQALAQGIMDSGCDVADVGRVPTPVLYFATHHLETRSGVMVTGSHNPPEYNGLKMVIAGRTLHGDQIQRLRQRIEGGILKTGSGTLENRNVSADYIGAVTEDIQIARPMRVVIDCGNGAAGELAPVLFRALGCEVVELFCEIDGNFPNHHPDPSKPENLEPLINAVVSERADLGLAFDGDGDRLGVVDSAGNIIWPDRQMMIFAADVLARHPGSDVIYDVKCSRHLAGVILKRGGRPIMWKTGHSLIKAKIKETEAKLAGEMSGHIFFNDRWYGFDDGLYAAARLIEILSADARSSSDVFADLPDSVNTPELNVPMGEGENVRLIAELQAQAEFRGAKITEIDGLRVDFEDGWGLVRASNTTPSLVMRFEADDQAALVRIQQQFKKLIKKIKPDLAVPF